MNAKDLITIIVPVYNQEKLIMRCLHSLQNQTYKNIEIIVINDGSTDNTQNVVLSLMKNDSRIKLYKQINKGPGSARNVGINKSSAEWMTFVDADDYVVEEYIEKLSEAMRKKADMSMCNFTTGASKKPFTSSPSMLYTGPENISRLMLMDMWNNKICTFMSFGKLIKKSLLNTYNIRFPENINNAEDLVFFVEYWSHAKTILYSPNALYVRSIQNNSLTQSTLNIHHVYKGRKIFNQKLKDYFKNNRIKKHQFKLNKYLIISKLTILIDFINKLKANN